MYSALALAGYPYILPNQDWPSLPQALHNFAGRDLQGLIQRLAPNAILAVVTFTYADV
jgi:hypothetical protein